MAASPEHRALSGLDWLVIAAAAVSLVLLITWAVQGLPGLPRPEPEPASTS